MVEFSAHESELLLGIARSTLETVTSDRRFRSRDFNAGELLAQLVSHTLPRAVVEELACFITLEMRETGQLRGCTGTLVARLPLAMEVVQSTQHTAFFDPRFPPTEAHEVPDIRIEISVLTPSQVLSYDSTDDLLQKLRPGVDGVTLFHAEHRGTFLPQVWERFSSKADFLDALCYKMRLPPETWREHHMHVETYTAVKLIEKD